MQKRTSNHFLEHLPSSFAGFSGELGELFSLRPEAPSPQRPWSYILSIAVVSDKLRHNGLASTVGSLQSPWGTSELELWWGIRQSAVESPAFYAAVSDWALMDLLAEHGLPDASFVFPGFPLMGITFMDDSVLWDSAPAKIQRSADAVVAEFAEWRLSINADALDLRQEPKVHHLKNKTPAQNDDMGSW